jgi:hypothetical protein
MLDEDDELDAAEAAPAAQAAGSAPTGHRGSPTHHADAATPPPAAPAAVQPRQGGSPEPQPHAPPWRAVEATIEIEGTPQRRIPCPVLYRPLKQRATVNATRPSAPRRPPCGTPATGSTAPSAGAYGGKAAWAHTTAQTPSTEHAAAQAARAPPPRRTGDGGRAPRRDETPPEVATAICASIQLQSGAPREQPLCREEVETLRELPPPRQHRAARRLRRANSTAPPPHGSAARREPQQGQGGAANPEAHSLAGLPLRRGTHAAEERARRATQTRRADAQNSEDAGRHEGHGTHRAPTRCPTATPRARRHGTDRAHAPPESRAVNTPTSPAPAADGNSGRLPTAAPHAKSPSRGRQRGQPRGPLPRRPAATARHARGRGAGTPGDADAPRRRSEL